MYKHMTDNHSSKLCILKMPDQLFNNGFLAPSITKFTSFENSY